MRLVIVSNRLPVSVTDTEGRLELTSSAGGLATGLQAFLKNIRRGPGTEFLWAGWPGGSFPAERHDEIRSRLEQECHGFPISLSQEETEKFYEGFCNNTLWPLCHYFPTFVEYDEGGWIRPGDWARPTGE